MDGMGQLYGLGANLLANLLATPSTLEDAQQRNQQLATLLGPQGDQPGLYPPDVIQGLAPPVNLLPGQDKPVLKQLYKGVGEVGQLLQSALGRAPDAPRLPVGTLVQIAQLREGQKAKTGLLAMAKQIDDPVRQQLFTTLAQAGKTSEALKLLPGFTGGTETSLLEERANLLGLQERLSQDGKTLSTAQANRLDTLNRYLDSRMRIYGQQRGLAASASAGASEAKDVRKEQRGASRGQELLEEVVPRLPQPKAAPLSLMGGDQQIEGDLRTAVYTDDMAPDLQQTGAIPPGTAIPPLVRGDVTIKQGDVTVELESAPDFIKREWTENAVAALARERGWDTRNPTPEQARELVAMQRQALMSYHSALQEAQGMGKALPAADREAIANMLNYRNLAIKALEDFSPEELDKFVGVFNMPIRRWGAFFNAGTPEGQRFVKFAAVAGALAMAQFGEGGKQLTPFEGATVRKSVPIGTEVGGYPEFRAKADLYIENLNNLIQRRLRLSEPRYKAVESVERDLEQQNERLDRTRQLHQQLGLP